ncbi:hypothetical protein CRUP_036761, partial [Coryphaenoides rupestris]
TNSIGHPLVLPLAVCEELLQSLEDSNALLPYVLRHMRSYQSASNYHHYLLKSVSESGDSRLRSQLLPF